MPEKKSTFLKRARKWAKEQGLTGPQAFLRYTMLNFVDAINRVSSDFVFKGGNLLWLYIKTPRATIDLDFSTIKYKSHEAVKKALEKACSQGGKGITYSITKFEEVRQQGELGAAITINYKTDEGASNSFDLDIVYAIKTEYTELPSPIQNKPGIQAATIENIIADKLAAVNRFKGGNTRLKDFDDLWRLSQSPSKIDSKKLKTILKDRSITSNLASSWIGPDMKQMWTSYRKRYADLPEDLEKTFGQINVWLKRIAL